MQTIKLDISQKNNVPLLYVKQRDVGHVFAIELYENGIPYTVDEDNTFAVWYSGASGDGNYTKVDGESAFDIDRNRIEVQMIMQMLNKPGDHEMCVVMYGQNYEQKGFWNIPYCVEAIPGADSEAATDYYNAFLEAQQRAEQAAGDAENAADRAEKVVGAAANAVTYTPQDLTEEQKAQARANIGIDDVLNPMEIIGNALGEVIALKDSSDYELQGLILYGKTTQNGTPTPDAPVELESVGDGGSVSVNVIGENNEQQTVTISTPDSLRGIPLVGYDVHLYSGNHTDANGQQWVCDEIDFVRGVHVQRISDAINPIFGSINRNNPEHDWVSAYTEYSDRMPHSRMISASLQSKSFDDIEPNASLGSDAVLWHANSSWGIAIRRSVLGIDADMGESEIVSLVNNWVAEKGITVHYCLATPVETALTDHAKLYTYKPNTTITNDGGAEIAVEYVADTKTYIDNKFAELATAIVNNT